MNLHPTTPLALVMVWSRVPSSPFPKQWFAPAFLQRPDDAFAPSLSEQFRVMSLLSRLLGPSFFPGGGNDVTPEARTSGAQATVARLAMEEPAGS